VQSTGLAVGVDSLLTTDTTPRLTGTVSDAAATVEVAVDGNTYDATNNGDGTWTLPDNTIDPALLPTDYDVAVTATHGLNVATDNTTDELKVRAKVTLGGDDDVRQAAFTDADGSAVIVGLSPARIGQVDLYFKSGSAVAVGGSARTRVIAAQDGVALDIVDVISDARVLSVRARRGETGGTTIGTITGDASLGKLSGRSTDLTGDGIDMDGGVIGCLVLRNIQADVTMGAQWDRGIVLRVGRNIEGSNILIGDSGVRSFVTGAMINSSVLLDVGSPADADLDQVYDLPDVDDIDGPKLIWTLRIRGYHGAPDDLMQNANIAAAAIFSASLKQAALDNRGSDFGLAAQAIGRLRLRQDNQTYLFGQHWLADPDDLTVRIDVA